ncbi:triose-phosphate isomerase [Candidatus Woesearchaeota archaeon]|nr:triose-phosphate isomerase [Candidatus Woesearchaeota archaeon]
MQKNHKGVTMKERPLLLINFKAYTEATGAKAVKLAKICETIARKKTQVKIILAVQTADLHRVSNAVSLDVYSQHLDPIPPGAFTGMISAYSAREAGAKGVILNHSEHQLSQEHLERACYEAKRYGLRTVVCTGTLKNAHELAALSPDFLAIEPPELIGGTLSVSEAHPDLISKAVDILQRKHVGVLVGAGIHSGPDVRKAIELGAQGVLVSSHIVKAANPRQVLLSWLEQL